MRSNLDATAHVVLLSSRQAATLPLNTSLSEHQPLNPLTPPGAESVVVTLSACLVHASTRA